MNILKGDKVLLRTGSSRVVHTDTWSIAIESTGLAKNGDPITFRVAFSHGEIAMMAKASRVAQSAKAVRRSSDTPLSNPGYLTTPESGDQ